MKVYFSLPQFVMNTYGEKLGELAIERAFEAKVVNAHFLVKAKESEVFDELCECDAIVVLPYPNGSIDKRMKFALNVMVALHKDLYLMQGNLNILKADLVTVEPHEVTSLH